MAKPLYISPKGFAYNPCGNCLFNANTLPTNIYSEIHHQKLKMLIRKIAHTIVLLVVGKLANLWMLNKNKKVGPKFIRWNTLIYNDLVRLHYYFSVSQVTQVATTDYQDFSSAGCTCGVHLVTILGLSIPMFDRKYFSPSSISNCIIFHFCPYLFVWRR